MDSKALLLLVVVGSAYCKREEVLFDSTTKTKLGWDKFQGGAGRGWLEKDYKTGDTWIRVYSVCDIDQKNPENWITSPSFDVNGADALWIDVDYTVSKCNTEGGCRFDIKSFESKSVAGVPMYVTWDPVIAINTSKSESESSIRSGEINMPVRIKNRGNKITIGFEDHGSGCTTITSFKAYVVVCEEMTSTLVSFPETSVLAVNRKVKGQCSENARVKSEPLSVCNVHGEWKNMTGECECQENFELTDGSCIAVSAAPQIRSISLLLLAAIFTVVTRP